MHRSERSPRVFVPVLTSFLFPDDNLWQERLDDVTGRLYQAWADSLSARENCERLLRECELVRRDYQQQYQQCQHLYRVVGVKQALIRTLLPHYPHPITDELQRDIDLY